MGSGRVNESSARLFLESKQSEQVPPEDVCFIGLCHQALVPAGDSERETPVASCTAYLMSPACMLAQFIARITPEARNEAHLTGTCLLCMKPRFLALYYTDNGGVYRRWRPEDQKFKATLSNSVA